MVGTFYKKKNKKKQRNCAKSVTLFSGHAANGFSTLLVSAKGWSRATSSACHANGWKAREYPVSVSHAQSEMHFSNVGSMICPFVKQKRGVRLGFRTNTPRAERASQHALTHTREQNSAPQREHELSPFIDKSVSVYISFSLHRLHIRRALK